MNEQFKNEQNKQKQEQEVEVEEKRIRIGGRKGKWNSKN